MASDEVPPYVGQVIIERGFTTRDAAERWMEREKNRVSTLYTDVETHLWEPANPIGAKKVER